MTADQIKTGAFYTTVVLRVVAQVAVSYCLSFKCDICVIAHNHSRPLQPCRWLRCDVIKWDRLIIPGPRSRVCECLLVVEMIPPSNPFCICRNLKYFVLPSRSSLRPAALVLLLPTVVWCILAAVLLWSVLQPPLSRDIWIKFAKLLEPAEEKYSTLLPAEPQPHWLGVC